MFRSTRPLSLCVRRFERLNERGVECLHVEDFVFGADIALYSAVRDLGCIRELHSLTPAHAVPPRTAGRWTINPIWSGTHPARLEGAERLGEKVEYRRRGRAEFVGVEAQVDADFARGIYQEIIGQSKVPECEEVWAGIHHRWGEAFLREISGLVACSGYLP